MKEKQKELIKKIICRRGLEGGEINLARYSRDNRKVGAEKIGFVVLNFTMLDGNIVKVSVEFHGLVGCSSVLILKGNAYLHQLQVLQCNKFITTTDLQMYRLSTPLQVWLHLLLILQCKVHLHSLYMLQCNKLITTSLIHLTM